ncbi:MAG: hypothetical protein GY856_34110, partial [bacterium]|nr:hypothetical protein [bacterium]
RKKAPEKKKRKHDPVYRRIFNRAQIMEEILRRFATGPWAAHLDFSTLEPVPADFVTKGELKNNSPFSGSDLRQIRSIVGSKTAGLAGLIRGFCE